MEFHLLDYKWLIIFYLMNVLTRLIMVQGAPTCSLLARTRIFKELGGFDPKIRRQEDVDFAIKLAMKGGHFVRY